MEREVPSTFQELHHPDSLKALVDQLARSIEVWAAEVLAATGRPLLGLCILRGGVIFFSDLMKACKVSIELGFCRTRSYSSLTNGTQLATIETDFLGIDFKDRDILLVDDVCDSGKTLRHLEKELMQHHGARSVRSATLIFREHPDSVFKPDWFALNYQGDEWFVGYGMEDCNCYMNYPALYCIKPTHAQSQKDSD